LRPRPSRSGVRYCIQLGNLPLDMDKEELFDITSEFGEVLLHDLWSDARNGCNAGVVEYGTMEEAKIALDELNDRRMDQWQRKLTARLEQRDHVGM